MTKRDLLVSKAKKKWIKRKINRLLHDFNDLNSHQIRQRLERIAKESDPRNA